VGLLSASDLVVGYAPGEEILKGVGLELEPGEVISIIGPNGAGKSTLLKAIAGILRPSRGEIRFRDRRIETLRPREICALGLAFVPQEMNIFPTMSVTENLEIGGFVEPPGKVKGRIEAILERFPILKQKRRDAARTLSGGQRQILAMAMALMVEPAVLLLDEPSAGLSRKGVTPASSARVRFGSMWRWMRALLNSRRIAGAKLSMPKPSTRKPASRIAASRSRFIESMRLVEMNWRPAGSSPARLAATMPRHSGRIRLSLVKQKMSSWKITVRTSGCAATMRRSMPRHSSAVSRPTLAVAPPWASCRKFVDEQKLQPIGQ
jgi:branched-chain amino acid transport system ATP-binding protein/neutral amino acid transport system ATP-binding protein